MNKFKKAHIYMKDFPMWSYHPLLDHSYTKPYENTPICIVKCENLEDEGYSIIPFAYQEQDKDQEVVVTEIENDDTDVRIQISGSSAENRITATVDTEFNVDSKDWSNSLHDIEKRDVEINIAEKFKLKDKFAKKGKVIHCELKEIEMDTSSLKNFTGAFEGVYKEENFIHCDAHNTENDKFMEDSHKEDDVHRNYGDFEIEIDTSQESILDANECVQEEHVNIKEEYTKEDQVHIEKAILDYTDDTENNENYKCTRYSCCQQSTKHVHKEYGDFDIEMDTSQKCIGTNECVQESTELSSNVLDTENMETDNEIADSDSEGECSDCWHFTALSRTNRKTHILPNVYRCRTCKNIFTSTESLKHHQLIQGTDNRKRKGVQLPVPKISTKETTTSVPDEGTHKAPDLMVLENECSTQIDLSKQTTRRASVSSETSGYHFKVSDIVAKTLDLTADKQTGRCLDCEGFNALSNETKIHVDVLPNVYRCRTCKNLFTSTELLDHHRLIQVGEYRNKSAPENSRKLERKKTLASALDEDNHKGSHLKKHVDDHLESIGIAKGTYLHYLVNSRNDNTSKQYLSGFRRWEKFIEGRGFSALPADPAHVSLYITHLMDSGSSCYVIDHAVYSIKWAHDLNGLADPTCNACVKNLKVTARRRYHPRKHLRDLVTSEMLNQLCEMFQYDNDLLVIRDLCMILLSFFGFLGYDELSSLACNDITLFEDNVSLIIRKSKTEQYRKGNEVVISCGTTISCPVKMLRKYLNIANIDLASDHFLFKAVYRSKDKCGLIFKNRKLSYSSAKSCILSRLKLVGKDLDLCFDSIRAGGLTQIANLSVFPNDRCWKRLEERFK